MSTTICLRVLADVDTVWMLDVCVVDCGVLEHRHGLAVDRKLSVWSKGTRYQEYAAYYFMGADGIHVGDADAAAAFSFTAGMAFAAGIAEEPGSRARATAVAIALSFMIALCDRERR